MNSHRTLNNLFTPGGIYNQKISNVINGNLPSQILLYRGIVIDLKRSIDKNLYVSKLIPQYSIKARILGINNNSQNIDELLIDKSDSWFPPLCSIHNISLPERGEEVLIIRESTKSDSKGYWISRVNETSFLNRYLKGEEFNLDNRANTGLNFSLSDLNNTTKYLQHQNNIKYYGIPAYYGDVISQGRSGSFIRHSFHNRNNTGVLEMGIVENRPYRKIENIDNNVSIGSTETKTLHIVDSKITDFSNLKKVTEQDETLLGPFQDGLYEIQISQIEDNERNFIFNKADEFISYSPSTRGRKRLHRSVLGEELNVFQKNLINILQKTLEKIEEMNNNMEIFLETFLNHTHALPEINIDIPEKEVSFVDKVRKRPKIKPRPPKRVRVITGQDEDGNNIFKEISIAQAPFIIPGGIERKEIKKKIKYDSITIGGEDNPRLSTKPISVDETNIISENIQEYIESFQKQNKDLYKLFLGVQKILSKVNFIN